MKLSESRLRQIINQEARRMLTETKYSMHNMTGPGDFSPDEADSLDGDTTCLKCTRQHGRIIVDEAGPRDDDAKAVQNMLDNYDPDSAKDLMSFLNEIGIEEVECDGEMMSIDEFIDSL